MLNISDMSTQNAPAQDMLRVAQQARCSQGGQLHTIPICRTMMPSSRATWQLLRRD